MEKIINELVRFRDKRNWKQFHKPANLAMGVMIESAELLENYQWPDQKPNLGNVKEELADIMSYCLLLCEHYDFNIEEIMLNKIEKNKEKYPVSKAYGKADKYHKL